ncbi:hypothetical protein [Lysinibacillus xylanilyticus]
MRKRSANVAAANVLSVRKRSDSNNKSGSSDAPRKGLVGTEINSTLW